MANLCVHSDFSTGYACFYHVFKDRVITKNPTRLLPEIPEGELTLQELSNYTKNPLLVRVFHELSWVEDMGSNAVISCAMPPCTIPTTKWKSSTARSSSFPLPIWKCPKKPWKMSQEMRKCPKKLRKMSQETDKCPKKPFPLTMKTI
ncbi:hypothetical protein NXY15_22060 [Bacteroides thetaiotaomicron]|nr:hypothetical protein NXY15_22060 [Bacteroides thetaiotaomicron]